jgi:hypothetical protein
MGLCVSALMFFQWTLNMRLEEHMRKRRVLFTVVRIWFHLVLGAGTVWCGGRDFSDAVTV